MAVKPQTAAEEYRKNPDIKKEDIDRLREWLDRQPHLPKLTEVDLIVHYHSCYNSLERTKFVIDLNYGYRTSLKYIFENRDPMDKTNLPGYDVSVYVPLPERTPEDYLVFFCALVDPDPSHWTLEQALKTFISISDLIQYEVGTLPGVVLIIDFKGVTFTHVTRATFSVIMHILAYLQEAMPVRLKAVHFRNTPTFMDRIMALIRPLMKPELQAMLHLHADPSTMEPFVAQRTLPKDAGGDYLSYKEIQENTKAKMKVNRQILIDEEKLRVQKSLIPKGSDYSNSSSIDGSFKKLDID